MKNSLLFGFLALTAVLIPSCAPAQQLVATTINKVGSGDTPARFYAETLKDAQGVDYSAVVVHANGPTLYNVLIVITGNELKTSKNLVDTGICYRVTEHSIGCELGNVTDSYAVPYTGDSVSGTLKFNTEPGKSGVLRRLEKPPK